MKLNMIKNKNITVVILSSLFFYGILSFFILLTIKNHNHLNQNGQTIAFEIDKKTKSFKRRSLSTSYTFILKVPFKFEASNEIKVKPYQVDVPVEIFYQYNVGDRFEIMIDISAGHKYILPGQDVAKFYSYLIGLSAVFLIIFIICFVCLIGYEKRRHNKFIYQVVTTVLFATVAFIGIGSLYISSWQEVKFYGIKYVLRIYPVILIFIFSIGCLLFSIVTGVKLLMKGIPKLNEKLLLLKKGMKVQGNVLKKEIKGQFIRFEYEFYLNQQRFSKKIHQISLYKGIDDISNDEEITIYYDLKNPARNVWEFE